MHSKYSFSKFSEYEFIFSNQQNRNGFERKFQGTKECSRKPARKPMTMRLVTSGSACKVQSSVTLTDLPISLNLLRVKSGRISFPDKQSDHNDQHSARETIHHLREHACAFLKYSCLTN